MNHKTAKTLELYEQLVATQPGIEIKGAKSSYTSLNGHMFSFITKQGTLALRLSPEAHDAFMKKHRTKPVVQHGAVMRGYVEVPAALLKRKAEIAKYFAASVEYIGSMKAKPTTRKKKVAKKAAKRAAKKAGKRTAKKAGKKAAVRKRIGKKAGKKAGKKKVGIRRAGAKKVSKKTAKKAGARKLTKKPVRKAGAKKVTARKVTGKKVGGRRATKKKARGIRGVMRRS